MKKLNKHGKNMIMLLFMSFFVLFVIVLAACASGYRYNMKTHDIDRPDSSSVKQIGNISFLENEVYLASFPVSATFYPDLTIPLIYDPGKTIAKVNDFEKLQDEMLDLIDNPSRKDFKRAEISQNGILSDYGHISEKVDTDKLLDDIRSNKYDGNFDLANYYVACDREQLELFKNFSEKIQNWNIKYTNGRSISYNDIEFVISPRANLANSEEELMKAVDINEELGTSAKKAINSYDTSGSLSFNFIKHNGEEIVVSGGTWGDVVDSEKEREAVRNMARSLSSDSARKPIMKVEMDNHTLPDTYIEVDKSEQKVYYYESGKCIVSENCVTGRSGGRETPSGTFYITEKKKEKDLKGADYVSHVHRWLRLTWAGVGLHDATWRSRFGGDIWRRSGSHGCINLPKNFAYQLYDMVESGTCVVVHS